MPNLNLDRAKTAVLSMDIQKATARRSSMFRERNVGQAARSVLECARKAGILVVHVVIDYQPAFFSPPDTPTTPTLVIVLEDCCAALSDDAHRVSLHIMDHLATLATSADFLQSV
jgi:nicotinamidase-related amidase